MIKLIFIGEDFYWKSKTVMSSIYTEDGRRYDWGFVTTDLKDGQEIHIRQANAIEKKHYAKMLADIEARQRV